MRYLLKHCNGDDGKRSLFDMINEAILDKCFHIDSKEVSYFLNGDLNNKSFIAL